MLGTIISALVVGAIIGALARLILPGRQNISILMTILLGALGAVIGSWLVTTLFGYNNNNGGIAWIGVAAGALVAAGLIVLYGSLTGRRQIH